MKSKLNPIVTSIFWGLLAADLFALQLNIGWLHFVSKPLLMPALILLVSFTESIAQYKYKKLIIAALFFSWLGDCALLFGEKADFFIIGLLSFLIAHIFYIIYFHKYKTSPSENWFRSHFWVALAVVSYSIALLAYLLPMLGSMKVPVAIYTCVITIMLLKAMASKNGMHKQAYWWFVGGAVFFVLSDSVLAINRFAVPFAQSSFVIMTTYCAAQWLIVQGALINGKVAENGSKEMA